MSPRHPRRLSAVVSLCLIFGVVASKVLDGSSVLRLGSFHAAFLATALLLMVSCTGQPPVTPIATVSACLHPWDGGKRAAESGLTLEEVTGRDMASFVENYNAAKPPTDYAPDHLYLLSHEDSDTEIMVMVQKDCIIRVDPIPTTIIPALRGGVAS